MEAKDIIRFLKVAEKLRCNLQGRDWRAECSRLLGFV
jgi:hypothetical protein